MRISDKVIRGSGGSKDGGGGTEMKDNLQSKQIATVVDALCEGPIVGLVNGMRSIYLNETVLMNDDGTGMVTDNQYGISNEHSNFVDVAAQWRSGTQDQLPLQGMPDVEFESLVNLEVKAAVPIIHTLNNTICNAVRVTVSTPMLTTQDKENGDLYGSAVQFKIEVRANGGSWVEKILNRIKGKTTSRYQRAFLIALDQAGPWDVRVTRITPDSTSVLVNNKLFFDSITGVIESKLSYPNTALVAMRIDSSQFNNIPNRAYGIKGLIISVPTNYDPETRVYSGVWDGTFKQAWTDNPAWCFYDLLTAKRYGLGDIIPASSVDKWSLYTIAQYCDQLVPTGFKDGNGNAITEPRFTCNLLLQSAEEAYVVIQNFASIFRAITFWSGGSIVAMQDRPADPISLYTNANAIDGMFTYSGVSLKQRHTVALVAWNDPKDFYRQKVEYVQDDEGVQKYGVVQSEVTAFGCASKGQAHRMGKWMLATEKYATETISFKAGMDGASLYPGAIINTSDVLRAGTRMGGRITAGTASAITLDAPAVLAPGKTYTLSVVTPTGALATRNVTNASGTHSVLNLSSALPEVPQINSVFILAASDLKPQSWRIIGVKEAPDCQVEITALAHVPEIFANVEQGMAFTPLPISSIKARPDAPSNLAARVSRYQINGGLVGIKVTLSWSGEAAKYRVRYRRENGAWEERTVNEPTLDIDNVDAAPYEFEVVALSAVGRESAASILNMTLMPDAITLPGLTGLVLESPFTTSEAKFKWNATPGATSYEVKMVRGDNSTIVRTVSVGAAQRYEYTADDMKADGGPWRTMKIQVRALGAFDATSENAAELLVSNDQVGALTNVTADPGILSIFFSYAKPGDSDFAGVQAWLGTAANFTPDVSNLVFTGSDTSIILNRLGNGNALVGGTTYHLKCAGFDTFGKDALNISASIPVIPMASNALSNNSITAAMLQDGILDVAKFAANVEPVKIVTAVPTTKTTSTIFNSTDGRTYTWNGTAYVKTVPAADVTGQLTNAQLAAIESTKITGTLTNAQIAAIAATKITGTMTSAQIADLAATKITGTLTSAQIADLAAAKITGTLTDSQIAGMSASKIAGQLTNAQIADLAAAKMTGQIVSTQITDSAVSTAKLAAGSVVAAKIAAGAVTAEKLLVGSVGAALNADPGFIDPSAWSLGGPAGSIVTLTDGKAGNKALREGPNSSGTTIGHQSIPVDQNKVYRVRCWARSIGSNGGLYIGVAMSDAAGNNISGGGTYWYTGAVNSTVPAAWTEYVGYLNGSGPAITAACKTMRVIALNNYAATTGSMDIQDLRIEEVLPGTLIQDGAITTNKLTADSVTSAKIAAGAIVTAKIAAGAVTTEKLSVTSFGDSVLLNPGFEDASASDATLPAGWTRFNVWGGSGTTAFRDTNPARLRSGDTSLALYPGSNASADMFSQAVPVSEGEQWYVSCWAKASGTNAGTSPGFYFRLRGGASPSDNSGEAYFAVENVAVPASWTRFEGTVTIPAGWRWAKVMFLNYQTNTGAFISIDDVEFKKVVGSVNIANGAITAGKIAAGSIVAGNIAADTITAAQIAANAITANELAAGAVIAGKIAANVITANELAAGSVVAGKIAAGSVAAADIAANVINARHLVVSNKDAVDPDPGFLDVESWFPGNGGVWPSGVYPSVASSYPTERVLCFNNNIIVSSAARAFKVEKGAKYRFKIWLYKNAGTTGNFSIAMHIPGIIYHPLSIPRTGVAAGYNNGFDWGAIPNDTWVSYSGVLESTTYDWMQFMLWGVVSGALYFSCELVRAADATLIVDGAITASKISADAIVAGKIAAGAVNARELAAGAITTSKLAVIGAGSALNPDPSCSDITAWGATGTVSFTTVSDGPAGINVIRSSTAAFQSFPTSRSFPLVAGKTYRASCWIRCTGGNKTTYFRCVRMNSSGGLITEQTGYENATVTGTWQNWVNVFTAESGTTSAYMALAMLWGGAVDGGYIEVQDVRLEEVLPGTLIKDGAITTSKITANAVTADKISVNNLQALSATIGLLRTASNLGRVEIADNQIRVYDDSNALRVKIGYLY